MSSINSLNIVPNATVPTSVGYYNDTTNITGNNLICINTKRKRAPYKKERFDIQINGKDNIKSETHIGKVNTLKCLNELITKLQNGEDVSISIRKV